MSELLTHIQEKVGSEEDPNHEEVTNHEEKTEHMKNTIDEGEQEEKGEAGMKNLDQPAPNAIATKPRDGTLPIAGLATKGERIHGLVTEYEHTVWDVHNNEAMKVDNESVKDWKESLNSLLLFAAIFAAVLTAFIIESKKLLEPDQTQILVGMVALYFNNLGNLSSTSFAQSDFTPSHEAVVINCLLFASLGASLCAALVSVMALQWVMDYDAAITRGGSSPEDRAKRRQFRYGGVLNWKMGEIIAALPLLLYSSVVLFWVGVILWMRILNSTVGYVVAGGAAMAAFLYVATTLLAAVFVSAPFRTPLSRGIYWIFYPTLSLIYKLFPEDLLYGFLITLLMLYWLLKCLVPTFIQSAFRRWLLRPILKIFSMVKSVHRNIPWSTFYSHITQFIKRIVMSIAPRNKVSQREDEAADANPLLGEDALCWLAGQLPISVDSYRRLVLLTGAVLSHPHRETFLPKFLKENGWDILDFLGWYHLSKALEGASPEDDEELNVLLEFRKDAMMVEQINAIEKKYKAGPPMVYRKRHGINFEKLQGQSVVNAVLLLGPDSLKTMLQAYAQPVDDGSKAYVAGMLRKWGRNATLRDAMIAIVPSIIEVLKENSPDAGSAVATALSKLADHVEFHEAIATAIPSIIQLLKDEYPYVKPAAAATLSKLAGIVEFWDPITTAIPSIVQLLKDDDWRARTAVASAFPKLAEHVEFRDAIVTAVPSIIQLLKDEDEYVRSAATTALSELAKHVEFRDAITSTIPSIIQLLKDNYPSVRSAVTTALSKLAEHVEFRDPITTTIPLIVQLLKDDDWDARSAVATALPRLAEHVEFRDPITTAIPSIVQLLKDDRWHARSAVATALSKLAEHVEFRDPIATAVPSILQLLEDTNEYVRSAATTALSELAEHVEFRDAIATAVPSILQLLEDEDGYVRSAATTALSELAKHVKFRDAIAISIPSIIQLLKDDHWHARSAAATALSNLAEHVEFRDAIASTIPSIVQLLKDNYPSARSAVATALSKLAEHVEFRDAIASTIPSIILLLDDTSLDARAGAATALGKLAQHADFQGAISSVIPSVIPLLGGDATRKATEVREAAVTAFGEFSQLFFK
ncbi:hypothetical protein M408DRAFT_22679 [Serendipita vermifera MAFF 305830]|uniref:TOG domain-containing protein n=1 Tax=Serendipita vermifera MAFF 305830 TaxID=933852 RepID=A0A0C2WUG4_SERVB|nr:hypothetical protein M408DRAFT_22679 [Serendipita vermifera MAFF 305830]